MASDHTQEARELPILLRPGLRIRIRVGDSKVFSDSDARQVREQPSTQRTVRLTSHWSSVCAHLTVQPSHAVVGNNDDIYDLTQPALIKR